MGAGIIDTAFEKRKRALFEEAMELPEHGRVVFLAELARKDASLSSAVVKLLNAGSHESDGVLNHPIYERKNAASAPIPSAIGKYVVLRHLGTGGMGSVYVCRDPGGHADVAVKVIRSDLQSESARRSFQRERDILKGLLHPNVCRLLDANVAVDGTPFIVMPLIQGHRLDAYSRRREMSVKQRLLLFSQVLAGVEYFHARNVVHRDLKPSNLFVNAAADVQILDFGIAKMVDHPKGRTGHGPTGTPSPFITVRYASPEQLASKLSGRSSDIYSLGVICYELLTGRHPFPGASQHTPILFLETISRTPPRRPSEVAAGLSGAVDSMILNALNLEPARRYSSARLFLQDLIRCLEGSPVQTHQAK